MAGGWNARNFLNSTAGTMPLRPAILGEEDFAKIQGALDDENDRQVVSSAQLEIASAELHCNFDVRTV